MTQQFDLLGDPIAASPRTTPTPKRDDKPTTAEIPAAQKSLAARLPKALHLGTSTWSFPGWQGIVYGDKFAPQVLSRHGLNAYAQHPLLRAVGIDRTFYAPIPETEYASYAAQVPTGFSFLCKAPNAVTSPMIQSASGYTENHNPFFLNAALAVEGFVVPAVRGLGEKAGPLVFQFSPLGREATQSPHLMAQRLQNFLAEVKSRAADAGCVPRVYVEVRNPKPAR